MNINRFKFYPVKIMENQDGTFTIQARNWEGAFSEAKTLEEAKKKATDLITDVINSLNKKVSSVKMETPKGF